MEIEASGPDRIATPWKYFPDARLPALARLFEMG